MTAEREDAVLSLMKEIAADDAAPGKTAAVSDADMIQKDIDTIDRTLHFIREYFKEFEDKKTAHLVFDLIEVRDHLFHQLSNVDQIPVIDLHDDE